MKACVQINITESLMRGLRVAVDDLRNEVSLLFQYERLLEYCFDCNIIGHKASYCPLKDFENVDSSVEQGCYGSWLCASNSPPRFWFNKKGGASLENCPIMFMGEASRIKIAMERARVRYSRSTTEELAPTSILEARERDEKDRGKLTMDSNDQVPKEKAVTGCASSVPYMTKCVVVAPVADGMMEALAMEKCGVTVDLGISDILGEVAPKEPILHEIVWKSKPLSSLNFTKSERECARVQLQHSNKLLNQSSKPIIKKTWEQALGNKACNIRGSPNSGVILLSSKLSHVIIANATKKPSSSWSKKEKHKVEVERNYENRCGKLLMFIESLPQFWCGGRLCCWGFGLVGVVVGVVGEPTNARCHGAGEVGFGSGFAGAVSCDSSHTRNVYSQLDFPQLGKLGV
ncbi:hypothetical protein F8388_003386 [Cannabis sativa]|uniref:Zinc knuckle CX2CX4HX4C domain-containing protein n=1 Tax=Cannabis sativa TaxID=3483 RepID=A0A7J6E2T1_CANSA|nr:hypothetical protein F8388_003386 [Cannabis sativa]